MRSHAQTPTVTTLTFSLGDDDLQRIADTVSSQLKQNSGGRWMTIRAASEYTSLSEEAIRVAAKRGKLVSHKASGRVMFHVNDVDAFITGGED